MENYWRWVIICGWERYKTRLRGGWGQMVGFLLKSAFFFLILYLTPWLGDVIDETKLLGASIAASMLSVGVITLLWDIVTAPKILNNEAAMRVADYRNMLNLDADVESVKAAMMVICKEGRELMKQEADESIVDEWKARALAALKANYSDYFSYAFENEIRFMRNPTTQQHRLASLVEQIENDTMSFGSEAERMQSMFHLQGKPLPWLEKN